jgi:hypothetical protein
VRHGREGKYRQAGQQASRMTLGHAHHHLSSLSRRDMVMIHNTWANDCNWQCPASFPFIILHFNDIYMGGNGCATFRVTVLPPKNQPSPPSRSGASPGVPSGPGSGATRP